MPYPVESPAIKHDFLVLSEDELGDGSLFSSLERPIDPQKLSKRATVYSYPDGPKFPGPMCRSLTVIGFLETSNPMVEKLLHPSRGAMQQCTIAVKRFQPSLPDRDKANSTNFAKFVTKLRRTDVVAVLSKDKYGRFGLLRPMQDDEDEKFAAECFVGDTENAKGMVQGNDKASADAAAADETEMWQPPGSTDDNNNNDNLWQPPGGGGAADDSAGLWMPPSAGDQPDFGATSASDFTTNNNADKEQPAWNPSNNDADDDANTTHPDKKRSAEDMESSIFHKDTGAATADKFYSGLTRTLDTRSESRLYHMRSFNGWVKATQIQELNPQTQGGRKRKGVSGNPPMRVLDLACGKGGDLGKWTIHSRKMSRYVGLDVARGSLKDAAIRARGIRNKLDNNATFTVADLGADVPGRLKSHKRKHMQPLLSWSLQDESPHETGTPEFKPVRGGGVSLTEKFDVVSIQFAIHYMMSTRKRARRFFRTVSELLEIGGNLIATTIDARIVIERLMGLGEDLRFDSDSEEEDPDREIVVTAGGGACRIRFKPDIVKRIFQSMAAKKEDPLHEDIFGLEYTFTLKEGSDHASGVGEAVDLPEWLTPIPVLKSLAEEAGLEMEYGLNFHEFYLGRMDPQENPAAHRALYNMKVLNKEGSISSEEWEISRLYCAIKFRKVREAHSVLEDDSDEEEEDDDDAAEEESEDATDTKASQQFYIKAMMKAKMIVGKDQWDSLSGDDKKKLVNTQLKKLMA
ncbi:mRNA cap guanine-N7 methyltransferase [Seminavis robusta]|uniref:mRNA (guanine-N(7))-methyltransferase n=1 Tax=Seminavis robusta TaxID=568900 RepID=A0A9N8DVF5_9STRA|nr:mRNA cap guanine-N7 methyltransferase [Seminavis robusta]|eukprot:Sro381_g130840.1 mRNA cap guanine-N7 methyltransferase (745) ;mRNA; f:37393-39627